jgi:hypothetical protein
VGQVQTQSEAPTWAPVVPAIQAAVVAGYGLLLADDGAVPDAVLFGLVLGSPLVFAAAWALGWSVQRRRGAVRADGSEYLIATVGNVLMGFGFVLSVLAWLLIWWFGHTVGD